MAEGNFPDNLYVRPINVSDTPESMGVATVTETFNVGACRVKLYKHGTLAGSETLQMGLYSDEALTMPVALSDIVAVSAFSSGDYWRGMVRFLFSGENLISGRKYYPAITASNYTRNAQTFYISFAFDWPIYVNTSISPQQRGGHIEFYKRS